MQGLSDSIDSQPALVAAQAFCDEFEGTINNLKRHFKYYRAMDQYGKQSPSPLSVAHDFCGKFDITVEGLDELSLTTCND